MKKIRFKEIDHTADVGIVAYGESMEEMFVNAAYGMLHISYGNLSIDKDLSLKILVEEPDEYHLLVSWLTEINYLTLTQDFLIHEIKPFRILKSTYSLKMETEVTGIQAATFLDFYNREIKAVTYHQLKIEKKPTGFECQVIFDI